jgi:hypothetical protein
MIYRPRYLDLLAAIFFVHAILVLFSAFFIVSIGTDPNEEHLPLHMILLIALMAYGVISTWLAFRPPAFESKNALRLFWLVYWTPWMPYILMRLIGPLIV